MRNVHGKRGKAQKTLKIQPKCRKNGFECQGNSGQAEAQSASAMAHASGGSAPDSMSALAAASVVAPVVMTSSTRMNLLP